MDEITARSFFGSTGASDWNTYPEFEHERDPQTVVAKATEFELNFPITIDNDYAYREAVQNVGRPAVYVIDKSGIIRNAYFAVVSYGDGDYMACPRTARGSRPSGDWFGMLLRRESEKGPADGTAVK